MKKVFQKSAVTAMQNTGRKFLTSSIKKALLTTMLLTPALAQALGLGGMTTNSALNEPFDAKIQLLNTNSEELQTLTVNLGDTEQFKNAGIERPFLLSTLKFEIIEGSSGSYLHITSNESIKEPFLNFLLEVNWAKGRLIREYTALLDPPVFDTNTRVVDTTELPIAETFVVEPSAEKIVVPEPVLEPVVAPVQQEQVENIRIEQLPDATLVSEAEIKTGSVVEATTAVAKPVVHEEPVVYQETLQQAKKPLTPASSYTTSKGDTLWAIASKNRPDRSVNMQQMMLSLLNSNPNAFINNNINALKTGQVLRIPDSDEINHLSKREAIALVKEHNALWDDYRQGLAANVAVRPEGAVSSTGTVLEEIVEEEILDEPEVRLVSATQESSEETNTAGDNEQAIAKTLENDLALAAEQLVSGENENAELKDKLKESEEIVDLLKQQVELKNQELAALQLKLREANVSQAEEESLAAEEATAKLEAEAEKVKLEAETAEAEKIKLAEEAKVAEEAAEAEKVKLAEEAKVAEEAAEAEKVKLAEEATAAEEAAEAEKVKLAEEAKVAEEAAEAEKVKLAEEAKAAEEAAEAEKVKLAEEAKAAEEAEPASEQSIDDILAELEGEGETETAYLNHEQEAESLTTAAVYDEYMAPAENLAGQDIQTKYLSTEDVVADNQLTAEDITASLDDAIENENTASEADAAGETSTEEKAEADLLTKLKGLLPDGIVESIPGGIKTVLGIALGLLGLLLIGVFKLFGKGKKEDAETLQLLDPEELSDDDQSSGDSFETAFDNIEEKVEDEIQLEESVEETLEAPTNFEEVEDEVEETFDFDIDEEEISEDSDLLNADEEELSTEGLINLEDTLDQIKPLLEQTEEDGPEEDPLEEVNLSLAYEQFDKAERLVNKAIEENPEEDGYKLRLLEVHYAANNKKSYEVAAKSLFDVTDGEGHLWESAVSMWSEMSPDRDLFESKSALDSLESTIADGKSSSTGPEGADVFDISTGAGIVAGMSVAGAGAALLAKDDGDDFINISDDTMSLDDAEMIDISAEATDAIEDSEDFLNIAETGEVSEDFLNIAETADVSEDFLNISEDVDAKIEKVELTIPETDSSQELELSIDGLSDIKIDEGLDFNIGDADISNEDVSKELEEDSFSVDMLDITAVGTTEPESAESDKSNDIEDFLELTNEFKTVDENHVSTKTESSAEILEFTTEDMSESSTETDSLLSSLDTDLLEDDSADDLESLAKSLEDTISGLDTGGLDDLTFEFDTDGTLEKTLTSTLGTSDLDLDNEGDEMDTKLNLAKAYIELGDSEGAKDILHEISADGSDDQKKDALDLLQQIS